MKLIWTDPSIEDLRSIREYIARGSDFYAANLVEQVVLSVGKLLQFPRLGRVVPEAQDENIRELVYQNYRIIYRIARERIEILAVVHGSRDLAKHRTPPWEIG
jgi:plasmid stabilization system protein ParE